MIDGLIMFGGLMSGSLFFCEVLGIIVEILCRCKWMDRINKKVFGGVEL